MDSRKGIGRGRGFPDMDDDEPVFGLNKEQRPPPAAGTEVQGLHNLPCRAARSSMPSMGGSRPTSATSASSSNGGGGGRKNQKKMNGYLLFALHKRKQIEKETGNKVDKPMDQVLRMFDEEWRNLDENEKMMWKDRAKAPPPQSNGRGDFAGREEGQQGGGGNANGHRNQGRGGGSGGGNDEDDDGW